MADSSPSKPLCERRTLAGEPCRGVAVTRDEAGRRLCRIHAGQLGDPVEAGRRSARARKAKRANAETWGSKVARWFQQAGDEDVARVMSTSQGAAAAMRLAEAELEREREREQADSPVGQFGGTTLAQVVALAYEIGSARLVGLPELTDTQLEELQASSRRADKPDLSPENEGVPFQARTAIPGCRRTGSF